MSTFEVSDKHRAHLERQREQRNAQSEREAARRRRVREQQRARASFVDGTTCTPEQLLAEQRALRIDFYERRGLAVPAAGCGASPTSAPGDEPRVEDAGEASQRAATGATA